MSPDLLSQTIAPPSGPTSGDPIAGPQNVGEGLGPIPTPPRKQKFKEGIETVSGRQRVKCYPVTLDQLENLAHVGWLAAALFSMATGSLVFSINLQTTLDLATGAPKDITAFWNGINHGVFYVSLLLYVLGVIAFFRGNKQKNRIMKNTIFPDD